MFYRERTRPLLKKVLNYTIYERYVVVTATIQDGGDGVTTNSATATNCVSLYDPRGIH